MSENSLQNNVLTSLIRKAPPAILSAIKQASARTGVDFAYLVEKAAAESSFRPAVKSATSSASGLFQFIESTWMQMVRDHGAKYGLGKFAGLIDGKGKVTDAQSRQDILALRNDPQIASFMAAEYAAGNKRYLEQQVGGDIGTTEMYLAHFMGPGGAAGFLKAHQENPLMTAADIFPKAARANRNVFYDAKTGEPRTLAGVYDFFDKKFQGSSAIMTGNKSAPVPSAPAATPAEKPRTVSDDNLWVYDLYRDRQAQALHLLGGGAQATPRLSHTLVRDPVEIMMMARLDSPLSQDRFNQ